MASGPKWRVTGAIDQGCKTSETAREQRNRNAQCVEPETGQQTPRAHTAKLGR